MDLKEYIAGLLEQQKRQLEVEFDKKLEAFASKLATAPQESVRIQHPVATASDLDKLSSQFSQAARFPSTAPNYRIYDGHKKTATVRAKVETVEDNFQLKSSTKVDSESIDELSSLQSSDNRSKKSSTAHSYPEKLRMYAEPYLPDKSNKSSNSSEKQNPIGANGSENDFKFSTKAKLSSITDGNSSSDPNAVLEDYSSLEDKLHSTTRMLIRKSEYLINDAKSTPLSANYHKPSNTKKKSKASSVSKNNKTSSRGNKQLLRVDEEIPSEEIDEYEEFGSEDEFKSSSIFGSNPNSIMENTAVGIRSSSPDMKTSKISRVVEVDASTPNIGFNDHNDKTTSQLPLDWTTLRHNDESKPPALSQPQWENEIARHILSLYVSSHGDVDANMAHSKSVLEFVDIDGKASIKSTEQYLKKDPPLIVDGDGAHTAPLTSARHRAADESAHTSRKTAMQHRVTTSQESKRLIKTAGDIPSRAMKQRVNEADEYSDDNANGEDDDNEILMITATTGNGKTTRRKGAKNSKLRSSHIRLPEIKPLNTSTSAAGSHSNSISYEPSASLDVTSSSSFVDFNFEPFKVPFSPQKPLLSTEMKPPPPKQSALLHPAIDLDVGKIDKKRTQTIVKNKQGEEIIIRSSSTCRPIWYVNTSDIYSDWTSMPGGERLQAQLNELYERKKFKEYLGIVERILLELWNAHIFGELNYDEFMNPRRQIRPNVPRFKSGQKKGKSEQDELFRLQQRQQHLEPWEPDRGDENILWPSLDGATLTDPKVLAASKETQDRIKAQREDWLRKMWRQLIATGSALGVLAVEKGLDDIAMNILRKAEEWTFKDRYLNIAQRHEFRAIVNNAMSYYFYRRGKGMTSMAHTLKAMAWHEDAQNYEGVAICYLHIAALEINMTRYKEAHKTTYLFLAMLEDGRLSFEKASPLQLCLIAIAYHNLAVLQLKMEVPDLACKNSQNARKIARLCLSYSNRWINIFQATHDCAVDDVKFLLATKGFLEEHQLKIVQSLVEDLYEPNPL